MIKRYTILVSIILPFLAMGGFTVAKNNDGILQMRETASKLSNKMTRDEVVLLIGEPTFENGFGDVYWFTGGERLILNYDTRLSTRNKDGFNLLRSEYTVTVSNFPVVIDGEKLLTSNPVLNVDRGKIYLSAQDFEKAFGLKVSWDKENQQLEAATKNKYGEYEAKVVDFSIFIDGNELITSNPIVAFDGNIYFSIQELAEELRIKINWNNEKKQIEITTNIDSFSREYAATVTDIPIFVNGKELLTLSPFITISGNRYLPIEEVEEELGIKVDRDEEKQLLKITNAVEGFTVSKNSVAIAMLKEDIGKLNTGMTQREVAQVLGFSSRDPNDIGLGINPPTRYKHKSGEVLRATYDNQDKSLSALFNKDGFDLLATGYIARTIGFPIFINDKELLISNPIVTIHNKVYVPLDNLAEQLGIKVTFGEERQQLEITTK